MIAQASETVGEIIKAVDRASTASDRWLFIAALVILLIFVGVVIKWLVMHIESKDKRIEEKEAMHELKLKEADAEARKERGEERAAFLDAIEKFKEEIGGQTVQLKNLTDIITAHDRDMRDAHRVETATLVRAELIKIGIDPKTLKQPVG